MFNKPHDLAFGACIMMGSGLLAACGTGSPTASSGASQMMATVVAPAAPPSSSTNASTTTAATVTAAPAGGIVVSPNGTKGESDVADNFDVNATLQAASEAMPPVDPDPIGAFRFECLAGQLSKDDPIVYPGQIGKSHLHQFFGNTETNASSTYQSLRTTGASTCTGSSGPTAQRSAYWMPAMLDGAGNAVKPNRMLTYYKRLPKSDPACGAAPDATHIGFCVPMPNGIRFTFGYNMATGKGGPADLNSVDQWTMNFDCWSPSGPQLTPAEPTLAAVVATGNCPSSSWLRVRIDFPDCWDGKNLDTPDHRSHMSYGTGALLPVGKRACPPDYPYNIPLVTMQAFFTTDANFVAGKWHLSSDEMMPGAVAGSTLHGDYWEAWSPVVKGLWQAGCIDAHLSCNNGELGNGQQIKGMSSGPYPDHVLVPLSSIQ